MSPVLGIGSSLRWAPFHVSTPFVSTPLVSGSTCSPRRPGSSLLAFRWYLNNSVVFRNQIGGWVSSQPLGCCCFWALPAAGAEMYLSAYPCAHFLHLPTIVLIFETMSSRCCHFNCFLWSWESWTSFSEVCFLFVQPQLNSSLGFSSCSMSLLCSLILFKIMFFCRVALQRLAVNFVENCSLEVSANIPAVSCLFEL